MTDGWGVPHLIAHWITDSWRCRRGIRRRGCIGRAGLHALTDRAESGKVSDRRAGDLPGRGRWALWALIDTDYAIRTGAKAGERRAIGCVVRGSGLPLIGCRCRPWPWPWSLARRCRRWRSARISQVSHGAVPDPGHGGRRTAIARPRPARVGLPQQLRHDRVALRLRGRLRGTRREFRIGRRPQLQMRGIPGRHRGLRDRIAVDVGRREQSAQ